MSDQDNLQIPLDMETAASLKAISDLAGADGDPIANGINLLTERIRLHTAGWELGDTDTMGLLEVVVRLNPEQRSRVMDLVQEMMG